MSDKLRYPSITDATLVPLRAIEAQLKQHPDLLDRSECPYPPTVKILLRRLAGEPVVAKESGPMGDDDLVTETSELYREIRDSDMTSVDAKDRAQIYKTQVDLLTKLVSLREKAVNNRQMSQFQKTVVELMETVLTPAQRSEFIEKMGKYV